MVMVSLIKEPQHHIDRPRQVIFPLEFCICNERENRTYEGHFKGTKHYFREWRAQRLQVGQNWEPRAEMCPYVADEVTRGGQMRVWQAAHPTEHQKYSCVTQCA